MSAPVLDWDLALTGLEGRLDHVEALLTRGDVDGLADAAVVDGLAPVTVDGPLPAHLRERASRVRERTEVLLDTVRERLVETGRALHAGETARRRAPRQVPAYLDEKA